MKQKWDGQFISNFCEFFVSKQKFFLNCSYIPQILFAIYTKVLKQIKLISNVEFYGFIRFYYIINI
jgi:hypothetical protein